MGDKLIREISPKAVEAYQHTFRRVASRPAAERFWDRSLQQFEREKLGKNFRDAIEKHGSAFGWLIALDPNLTGEQAVLDVAFAIGILTQQDRDWLVREIVDDKHQRQFKDRPEWNRERGELKFQGQLIRKVRVSVGTRIVPILDEFEQEGWPERIDSPFDDETAHRENIRSLNEGLRAILFQSDGTGRGILWQMVSPPAVSPTHLP